MCPDQPLNDSNRNISVQGDANAPLVTGDRNTFSTHYNNQNGLINIHGQQVQVQNLIHQHPTPVENYLKANELCQNRQALERYLESTLTALRQHGCQEIRQNIEQGSQRFDYVARIEDFELPFWPVSMRGEAFFVFSEFSNLHIKPLRQFSSRAMQWAKTQVKAGSQARRL